MKYFLVLILLSFSCGKELPPTIENALRFEGLKINHRFKLPVEDFTTENKSDFQKIQKIITDANTIFVKSTPEKIVAAIKKVFKTFPYPSFTIQKLTNFAMIKKDFPGLSTQKIIENKAVISQYYELNLVYEVLQILKLEKQALSKPNDVVLQQVRTPYPRVPYFNENCEPKMKGYSGIKKKICIAQKIIDIVKLWQAKRQQYNYLKIIFALLQSKNKAEDFSGINNRTDAKRHIYGSILLAKYYFSLFPEKDTRAELSEKLGTINEECSDNFVDGSAMDTHNNAVGVYLFKKHMSIKADGSFTLPTDENLKKIVENWVDTKAIKISDGGKTGNLKICERKNQIQNLIDKTIPVYLVD